jgi:hypothetical protein
MPSIRGKGVRYLLWLCFCAATAPSLGGCSYSAEDSWKICCSLHIVGDETSSPAAQKTIIDWERRTTFGGDGVADRSINWSRPPYYSWTKNQIASAVTDFLAANPGARASDYLLSLGMTCRSATIAPKANVTRCEIELPVWVECSSLNIFFPGGAPVPEELRKPISALLDVSVEVSASSFLDSSARVVRVPGGRLCHR